MWSPFYWNNKSLISPEHPQSHRQIHMGRYAWRGSEQDLTKTQKLKPLRQNHAPLTKARVEAVEKACTIYQQNVLQHHATPAFLVNPYGHRMQTYPAAKNSETSLALRTRVAAWQALLDRQLSVDRCYVANHLHQIRIDASILPKPRPKWWVQRWFNTSRSHLFQQNASQKILVWAVESW